MRIPYEGFCGPTYEASSRNFNMERCINLFPEFDKRGVSKSGIVLLGTPGLSTFITLPSSPVRCLWAGDDRVFVVSGIRYGEIKATPTISFDDRGIVATTGANPPAQILSNGTQLLIVTGGLVYVDGGGAPTGANAVLIGSLPAIYGTYLDGYFLVVDPVANHIRYSELFDGSTWPALNFFTRAGSRDALVACVAHNDQLWLFGKRFIDAWYNSGNADIPFQPIEGSGISQGVLCPFTIAELDSSLFFTSEDDRGYCGVFRTHGFQLERVSNHAVEAAIKSMGTDQCAYTYEEDGHRFYVLTNYGGSQTFVYDVSTKMWHERAFWDGSAFTRQIGRCHCYTTPGYAGAAGTRFHLVGARNSGVVYEQSLNVFTDGASQIRRYRQAPHIHSENKTVFHHAIELELNAGTFTGAPEALMKWTDDDGASFSNERAESLGTAGEFNKRVIWRRNGDSRDRVYGVTFHSVLGRIAIPNAYIDITVGNS